MSNANYVIEIENLTKKYGGNKALDNISFGVKRGEIMGFLGPNGAGKSTTMNIICGYISANSGKVSVCGMDILEKPALVKTKIGYLPETPPLYMDMTVGEYLSFVYDLKKIKLDKSKHLREVMERVMIYEKKDRLIKNLSKGYKQRVGLAQALIGNPEVLILDEPTVGLDPKQIVEIRSVIKELGKQCTVILSTHILQEVEAVCDSVTIILNGKIVAQNTLEGIIEDAAGKDEYILGVFDSESDVVSAVEEIDGVISCSFNTSNGEIAEYTIKQEPGSDIRLLLTKALADKGISIASLRIASLTLEEIFIKLTATDNTNEVFQEEITKEADNDASNI